MVSRCCLHLNLVIEVEMNHFLALTSSPDCINERWKIGASVNHFPIQVFESDKNETELDFIHPRKVLEDE